jgi:hypothetical protein
MQSSGADFLEQRLPVVAAGFFELLEQVLHLAMIRRTSASKISQFADKVVQTVTKDVVKPA